MKKVHFTQSQIEECMKKLVNEVTLSADEQLASTRDPKQAVQKTIDNAQSQGIDTNNGVSVTMSGDALKKAGISECFTKKSLKEAKLKSLKNNSYCITKKDLKK